MRTEPPTARPLVLLAILAACGSEPASPPTADPPAQPAADGLVADAPTPAEPVAGDPVAVEPAEPTPSEPTVEPPSSPLRVVALREGNVDLHRYHDAPIVTLEGEPVAWVGGRFTPDPGGSRGLGPSLDPMTTANLTVALGGDRQDPRPTWITLEQHRERVGASYEVKQRRGDRWQAVSLRKPPLVAHYAAYVEREGALLALQTWSLESSDDEEGADYEDEEEADQAAAKHQALMRTLARAKPRWVQLSGAAIAVPEIPAKTPLVAAVSTGDGTIHAVTAHGGEVAPHRMLLWPAGATKAEPVAVPELEHAREVRLSTSGEWVLAYGSLDRDDVPAESFLAVGQGDQWQRIPTILPDRSEDGRMNILAAARAADGELWIALGIREMEVDEPQPVWRKPVDGAWEPVPLPTPSADRLGPSKRWLLDGIYGHNDWAEQEREALGAQPKRALGLVWAGGSVWVALDLGHYGVPLVAVMTTDPSARDLVVLPPAWTTEIDRYNESVAGAKPGGTGCDALSVVVGPASLASDRPELEAAINAIELDDEYATLGATYTGELDGAKVLVVRAFVDSPKQATKVRKAVAEATGLPVALDCRIPLLETMVSQ